MQALFILPLLMSVLAMAISLLPAVWPGAIIMVDFIMLSAVQASESLANAIRIFHQQRFRKTTFF
jgi:hypothetical protein